MRIAARANDGRRSGRAARRGRRRPPQRQVRQRGDAPSRERHAREHSQVYERDDHDIPVIGRDLEGHTPTNVELLNPKVWVSDNSDWKGSQGGSRTDTEVNPMKARMYRLALVAGVVAVFLEGLGAGLKWG